MVAATELALIFLFKPLDLSSMDFMHFFHSPLISDGLHSHTALSVDPGAPYHAL